VHTGARERTRDNPTTPRRPASSYGLLPLTPPQIIEKDPLHPSGPPQTSLVEIGPRFVLTPIRIFEGSFGGPTLFANPEFISPAAVRAQKYRVRKEGEMDRDERRKRTREEVPEDQLARKKVFA
jgi:ribosome biogenesis protein BRX1